MASGFKRLLADHASLHNSELPPNYLFPPSSLGSSIPDDLRQLTILLTGPSVTPYAQGVWPLHLRIPFDYPQSPPKATFKTRIWHPNVDESTGAVCVDTLKRDWEPKLTLRDVLVTISCLLIHPNPESALNSAAGALLQDDYEAFARQAKLMTSIHAPIAPDLRDLVLEAKRRGEDPNIAVDDDILYHEPIRSRKPTRTTSGTIMKKSIPHRVPSLPCSNLGIRLKKDICHEQTPTNIHEDDENEKPEVNEQGHPNQLEDDSDDDPNSASKENDPSLSPSPVIIPSPTPRKGVLGKRPLAALAPPEPDEILIVEDDDDSHSHNGSYDVSSLTASQRNIAANLTHKQHDKDDQEPSRRKSPKLSSLSSPGSALQRPVTRLPVPITKRHTNVPSVAVSKNPDDISTIPSNCPKSGNSSSSNNNTNNSSPRPSLSSPSISKLSNPKSRPPISECPESRKHSLTGTRITSTSTNTNKSTLSESARPAAPSGTQSRTPSQAARKVSNTVGNGVKAKPRTGLRRL